LYEKIFNFNFFAPEKMKLIIFLEKKEVKLIKDFSWYIWKTILLLLKWFFFKKIINPSVLSLKTFKNYKMNIKLIFKMYYL
jgi:hypothetical protein